MTVYIIFSALLLIIVALFIMVEIKIGKYVLKDTRLKHYTKNYQMLWVLVSVLVPYFLGFGIYLISRNFIPNKECSQCHHRLNSNMAYCPYCGTKQENNESSQPTHATGLRNVILWVIVLVVLLLISFIGFVIYSYFNPELIDKIYQLEIYFENKYTFLR